MPSSIADRIASTRARSRAISVIRSWSWSAERFRMRASSPSSSVRETVLRASRLPAANWRAASITLLRGPASEDERTIDSSAVITNASNAAAMTAPAR